MSGSHASLPRKTLDRLRQVAEQVHGGGRRGRGFQKTILFVGAAEPELAGGAAEVAGSLGLGLYRVDLSAVVSKYIGETEKNLRRVFDAAEAAGSVLLFDEADALFGDRTDVEGSHDRYANLDINDLLDRIEDFSGVVILASNRADELPKRLVRANCPEVRFRDSDPPP